MTRDVRRRKHRPRVVDLGGRSATISGIGVGSWQDLSHAALACSWPVFILGAGVAFLILNLIFALLFALGTDAVANVPEGSFAHYVYFSIETLATVGYGDMHPRTGYGHLVASAEMFVGIFYAAVLTGLIFNRFARPRARILFARSLTLTRHNGQPTLMLRMANERSNAIANASAKLWYLKRETSAEGFISRTFSELALVRRESPAFLLSWTIFHVVDETSPLHGLSKANLEDRDASFTVLVDGYDESADLVVRARHNYGFEDLRFGARYVDILEPQPDRNLRVDYTRFHDTVPDGHQPRP